MNKIKEINTKHGSDAEFLITLQKEIANELSITLSLREAVHVLLEHLIRIDCFFGGAVYILSSNNDLQFEYEIGLPSSFKSTANIFKNSSPEVELALSEHISLIKKSDNRDEFLIFDSISKANSFITAPVKLNREIVALLVLISEKEGTPANIVTETVEAVSAKIGGVIGRLDSENLLREHQTNFESLFKGINDMLFIVNTDGRIIHFNPIAAQKLGYSDEDLSNMYISQIHPAELSFDIKNTLEKAFKGKTMLSFFPLLSATGEMIASETTYSLGKWDGKDMLFLVVRDMRERKAAQEEITIERKKAEEANKAKTVFLANMSHAFRIPMNSIIGMSELLLKTDLTKKQFNFLNVIIKSAENLMVIVNDLLDISKIESGEIALQNKTFSLKDVISSVINNQFYNVRSKGIELLSDYVVYGDDYYVKGDSARLNQILLNLVENAIKYTEKGKVEIKVAKQSGCNEYCTFNFEVSDTGIGITTERMKEIIGSFANNRPISTETSGGSGLGLVISNKLIELMGGKLEISSIPERGSVFSFKIKFSLSEEGDLFLEEDANDKMNFNSIDKIRVLLAEDQVFNQMVVQSMIEDWGFEIDIVENGLGVIEKLKTTRYDVVLMDIQMPIMDGVEATRQIRKDFKKPVSETPIIAITANAYSEDHRKYIEAGMNDTISKPFKSQVLFHKIANSLGMANANFSHSHERFNDNDVILNSRDENLFDLSVLKGISKGSKQTIEKMLTVFIEKTLEEMGQIKTATENQNWQQITTIAHKMKPALSYLGMKLLENKINEIQRLAKEMKEVEKIPPIVQLSEQLLNKIILLLKKEIAS
ncbi:MAG: response regulator [Bacteroidia bacterium]|nr:response regulator [Bacteroidia bacterium]